MILIVDDDPIAGEISQAFLEAAGHETTLVESVALAKLRIAGEPAVDLVVSDHHMPGASGIELFEALRATGSGLPFVLLSGDDPETLRSLAPGIDAFVAKDEALGTELPATVSRLLSGEPGGSPT